MGPHRAYDWVIQSSMGRQIGHGYLVSSSLGNLALCQTELGELDTAERFYREGLALARASGDRRNVAIALQGLGDVAGPRNDARDLLEFSHQALPIYVELGDLRLVASTLDGFGYLALGMGLLQRAVRLLGAAQGLRDRTGQTLSPRDATRREAERAKLQTAVGDASTFEALYAEGRAMTLEQAVQYAMSDAAD